MDNRVRLLLIEDDDWVRHALGRLLELRGFEVWMAPTLDAGLELLDLGPDCVILDLRLPDGNGQAILRHIREQGLSCRVVICSAVADAEAREELGWLRPDAVYQKPVDVDVLIDACRV